MHQRYRQTTDRQTDGMAIAYSERKRKFTFAHKISHVQVLTVDSLQLMFVPTSMSRNTKTKPNINNPAQTNLNIVP